MKSIWKIQPAFGLSLLGQPKMGAGIATDQLAGVY
jgi:hypothetical protein